MYISCWINGVICNAVQNYKTFSSASHNISNNFFAIVVQVGAIPN